MKDVAYFFNFKFYDKVIEKGNLKNDPSCYAGGIAPTVKAKFRVLPKINSARLSAETVGAGSPLGGLGAQTVTFANGLSDWTEFQMNATIPRTVRKADHRWAWNVSQIDGAAVTEFVCATTGPHRVYVVLDRLRPLDDATRSRFKTHTFAMFDFQVYDACVGPVTGLGYIPYLLQTIDYSTADEQFLSALSEDERVIPLKKS